MLTRGRIVEAGLRILDAWGLGDLTMRRVADELGVKAGALYYHMPNKQSLLAEIADVILTPVAVPRATDTGEWLRRIIYVTRCWPTVTGPSWSPPPPRWAWVPST